MGLRLPNVDWSGFRAFCSFRASRFGLVSWAVLAALLSSCEGYSEDYSNLPPCVDSYCDCSDFASQDLAQLVFDSFKEDYYGL
ncbi:MAG: hypothetical protein AAFY72_19030, partial [Cyanobacteria bacterium J06649_4]